MADLMAALEEALGIEEQDRLYGLGAPQVAVVSPPAVGVNWSCTPSSVRSARILAVCALFTTTAVVGLRQPLVSFRSAGGTLICNAGLGTGQAASNGWVINWILGGVSLTSESAGIQAPLPHLWIPPGAHLDGSGVSDVGDAWSNIAVTFQLR